MRLIIFPQFGSYLWKNRTDLHVFCFRCILWTRKYPLNFGSRPDSNPDPNPDADFGSGTHSPWRLRFPNILILTVTMNATFTLMNFIDEEHKVQGTTGWVKNPTFFTSL